MKDDMLSGSLTGFQNESLESLFGRRDDEETSIGEMVEEMTTRMVEKRDLWGARDKALSIVQRLERLAEIDALIKKAQEDEE